MSDPEDLISKAKDILDTNDQGNFTIPAMGLYPHQWLWDSCFVAIGLRHIDTKRARAELLSLLRGQWSNGMLPNMIFSSASHYRADRQFWRSHVSPYSPEHIATSGITQPPMLAEAIVQIGSLLPKSERRSWYQTIYPALLRYHKWLYSERSPNGDGLVICVHPYESGMDNSPPWSIELRKSSMPWWIKFMEKLGLESMINFFRRDTRRIPPGERMNIYEALGYVMAVLRLRRKSYNIKKILSRPKLVMYDLAFNCIFIRANSHLENIAKEIGRQLPDSLQKNIDLSRENLDQLWDGYSAQYQSKSYSSDKLSGELTIATLLSLYSGAITEERAEQMVDLMNSPEHFSLKYPVPSVPASSIYFDSVKYWQGPTWINMNWLLINGLEQYGYDRESRELRTKSIQLAANNNMYEYFNPVNGKPQGAEGFSWTAALILDLVKTQSS